MGAVLGLAQAGLLVGDVHEVIDVGVIGGKCPRAMRSGALPLRMGRFINVIITVTSG